MVYLSDDAYEALVQYLRVRPASRVNRFSEAKGRCRGKAISVRGIQKRLEHYARQARLKVSCHQLRHTYGHPKPPNADAALVTIQDLLGHTRIKTTQRYCRVSNLKVQRDYHRAMAAILQITG